MMSVPECPPLLSLPKTNTSHTTPDISLSSHERYIGTEVTVTCPENYYIVGHDVITCMDSLEWSADSLPHCTDVLYGVPESTKLYIAVFSACALLVLCGFAVVIGKMVCRRKKDDSNIFMKSTVSVASLEYFPNDKRYRKDVTVPETDAISDNFKQNTSDEHSKVLGRYREQIIDFQNDAIEQNFETFINPSFCDDESTRERWQRRINGYDVENESHDRWQSPVSGYESSFDDDSSYEPLEDESRRESVGRWSINSYGPAEDYNYNNNDYYNRYDGYPYPHENGNPNRDDTTPF